MKKWEILTENTSTSTEDIIHVLLENRGIKTKTEREAFINPLLESVTADNVAIDKKNLTKTLKRIKKAIDNNDQIVVYGDYDVDGITGTAILWETLFKLGAKVTPYIPHRVDEGYGLSVKGIENLVEKMTDIALIITVDNGIVANDAVNFAKEKNIEVIITDHHVPSDGLNNLPNAFSIVHTTKLCGAGVAYVLSHEVNKFIANTEYQYANDTHLELAALGTVADLVPLKDGSRTIVKFGLEKLCQTKRHGLLALFQEAACEPSSLGVYEIGHIIAPRLNAAGRLETAMDSLRLLCTKDANRAAELASKLGFTNKERQGIMFEATKHASLNVKARSTLKKLLVVADDSYNEGVIGLVAGRLVEEYYRPAIVIARREKYSKGSVRSVSGFNIIEFLRSISDYFINVGGHPMAAGFTVETSRIEELQSKIEELAESLVDDASLVRTLRVDCEIPLSIVNNDFYKSLQQLSPFGMGNPEPTFASKIVEIRDMKIIGKDQKHVRFVLSQNDSHPIEAIAFGMAESARNLRINDEINVVYTLDENEWNGRKKLQLKVKDIEFNKSLSSS